MRWQSGVLGVQLLCLLQVASAVPEYEGFSGRREALLLYKRQGAFCVEGYFQCPPEFGGGCCANGRRCATLDCPAIQPNAQSIPNAVSQPNNNTPPPPATPTPTPPATPTPTPAANTETNQQLTPASQQPTQTSAAETTAAQTSRAATSTNAPPSSIPRPSSSSRSGTATSDADAAEATESGASEDGTQYTPMGISMGAVVGIAFAGVTGAVILGLVLWRAIIGIRHPKKGKGKKRAAPPGGADSAAGAAGAGARGLGGNRRVFDFFKGVSLPTFGKKNGGGEASQSMMAREAPEVEDQAPMSQSAAAMGFGPQPSTATAAPPYMQDRSSLEEQDTSYNRGGGDLGYRSVASFEGDDDTQGLFPRQDRGPGFPDR